MDIFEHLLTDQSSAGADPELLEVLGTQAARRYLDGGEALNDTIRELVSQHPELNNEHIKRVAEFANNVTFQELHQKSDDKNVVFDIANPGDILRDVKDGGTPSHDGTTLRDGINDYSQPPSEGLDSQQAQEAAGQFEAPSEDIEKNAFVLGEASHANPIDDVYDTHVQLEAAKEELEATHAGAVLARDTAREEFEKAARKEILDPDGLGFAGVMRAVELHAPNTKVAFSALRPTAEKLVADRELKPEDLEKNASSQFRVPNPEHPLLQSFRELVKSASQVAVTEEALREVETGLSQTSNFLRSIQ